MPCVSQEEQELSIALEASLADEAALKMAIGISLKDTGMEEMELKEALEASKTINKVSSRL